MRLFYLSPLCRYAGKVLLRPLAPHTLYHARVAAANSYGLRCVADRDHGMDTQDLEFKFFAKRVESSYVVTATYV